MSAYINFIRKGLGISYLFLKKDQALTSLGDSSSDSSSDSSKKCAFLVHVENPQQQELLNKITQAATNLNFEVVILDCNEQTLNLDLSQYSKVLVFGKKQPLKQAYWQKTYSLQQLLEGPVFYKKELWSWIKSWN